MTESLSTPGSRVSPAIRAAFEPWLDYTSRAESLVHLTYEGLSRVQMIPELLRLVRVDNNPDPRVEGKIVDAEARAALARVEEEGEYAFLHAHSLLGLWGALECLVEDLFMARLADEPALLAGDAFRKIRLPVSLLAKEDPSERLRAVVTEMTRATDSDLAQGVGKFERLLEPVGLGGSTPRRIRDAVFTAQQVRNIWAHRAGLADRRFAERCPSLGFSLGSRVDLDTAAFMRLMHGLHMYGVVIVNRCLVQVGGDSTTLACPGYEEVWTEVGDVQAKADGAGS